MLRLVGGAVDGAGTDADGCDGGAGVMMVDLRCFLKVQTIRAF